MDGTMVKKAKIRRAVNFIIEENIEAVQWPRECSACGGIPTIFDRIKMEKKFKNFGIIISELRNIPYCKPCFQKVIATKGLDKIVLTLALIFGIPLGLLLSYLMAKDPGTRIVCLGLLLVAGVGIAWVFFYLLIRFPVKSIFKNNFTEYIDAWLFEDEKADRTEGLSVMVSIPNKRFAEKFAVLNEVPPGGVK
ncbi:MAG: hypothetical protein FD147_754 [Chloroflexi bacterium]|nr:MAG: hypothetical protein FD147_754 [Chloroflexota bacterium]MBA4376896.1 hypothetical protein [Anaerolinea sp.]